MGKYRNEWLRLIVKREKVVLLGVCLALMGFALIGVAFSEFWFSESNYAYFVGEIDSWEEEELADGLVCVAPESGVFGDDPEVMIDFETRPPDSGIYYAQGWFKSYMIDVSMVEFDYDGKDFYMSGTWEIRKKLWIFAENITDMTPFVDGLNITDIAVVNYWSNTSITDFLAAEFEDADITVFNLTEGHAGVHYSWHWYDQQNVTFTLSIGGVEVGSFDLVIEYGDGELAWYKVCIADAGLSSVPGELYVTGNWTDFAGYIEGIGMFSGKVAEYKVKHEPENPTVARTDMNHNRKIDIRDLYLVARAYGSTISSPRYDPDLDINADSIINLADLIAVARNFGRTY